MIGDIVDMAVDSTVTVVSDIASEVLDSVVNILSIALAIL